MQNTRSKKQLFDSITNCVLVLYNQSVCCYMTYGTHNMAYTHLSKHILNNIDMCNNIHLYIQMLMSHKILYMYIFICIAVVCGQT